ncbi:MAG: arylesterase, partial [Pseudomonadota bacterium]
QAYIDWNYLPLNMMINYQIPRLPGSSFLQNTVFVLLTLIVLLPLSARAASDKLLIVGDSLSAAYGIPVEKGWVAELENKLDGTRFLIDVVNASVSGDTTANGLTKMPALVDEHQPAFVIIELGGNDGLRGQSIKKMSQNLTEMTQIATGAGAQVIIVGMQIPSNYGAAYTRMFRDAFGKVADTNDAHLVPFLLRGLESGLEWFQSDGVHPNVEAQPIMMNNIWEVLEPLLEENY